MPVGISGTAFFMSADVKLAIQFYNSFFDTWPQIDGAACSDKCTFRFGAEGHLSADVVVFHLPTLQYLEYIDKAPGQIWVAWCMESIVTCPLLDDPIRMSRFDMMMDYRRSADIWVPYFDPGMRTALLRAPPQKPEHLPWFISNRITTTAVDATSSLQNL